MSLQMDSTSQLLAASLDGSTTRQNAIAHNISNANTPGYKSFSVDLEQQMKNLESHSVQTIPLKVTSSKHMKHGVNQAFEAERDTSKGQRADGNNVDLDQEMALMVKNDVYFNAALNQLNKKISMKKFVLADGRG